MDIYHLARPSAEISAVLENMRGVVLANNEEVRLILVPRTNHHELLCQQVRLKPCVMISAGRTEARPTHFI